MIVDDAEIDQRADHGHQHADGGQLHAAAGLVGRGQSAQAEDEQHRGGQVGGLDEELAQPSPAASTPATRRIGRGDQRCEQVASALVIGYFRSWRLNILSMRSVIMNPPTTLIVAAVTATKPRNVLKLLN